MTWAHTTVRIFLHRAEEAKLTNQWEFCYNFPLSFWDLASWASCWFVWPISQVCDNTWTLWLSSDINRQISGQYLLGDRGKNEGARLEMILLWFAGIQPHVITSDKSEKSEFQILKNLNGGNLAEHLFQRRSCRWAKEKLQKNQGTNLSSYSLGRKKKDCFAWTRKKSYMWVSQHGIVLYSIRGLLVACATGCLWLHKWQTTCDSKDLGEKAPANTRFIKACHKIYWSIHEI